MSPRRPDLDAGRITSLQLTEQALARIADPAGEGARVFPSSKDTLGFSNAIPSRNPCGKAPDGVSFALAFSSSMAR